MPDQKNIQGDTWPRLPKKAEKFVFFRITNPQEFKNALPTMADFITTAHTALVNRNDIFKKKAEGTLNGIINLVSLNIAFSANGLAKLGAERFNDDIFNGGQFKDMTAPSEGEPAEDHLGLDPQQDWVNEFKPSSGGIDGVLTVAGDSIPSIDKITRRTFDWVFNVGNDNQSVETVYTREGQVFDDHLEHFGWVDGISQPLVKGLDDLSNAKDGKGMTPVDPGVIFVGHEGDEQKTPKWAKDGSFMVFRIYEQLVPEFYHWCAANCSIATAEVRKAMEMGKPIEWSGDAMRQMGLFSSRLVGRWPGGAPMELHPLEDPGSDKNKAIIEASALKALNHTDSFNYNPADQTRCPYASHMRKTGPRDDYPDYAKHVMMRRGIPYGPWCDLDERAGGATKSERGLLFVSYQSSIENGFVTQQKRWANSSDGPTDMAKHGGGASQGIDPLIGQVHPSRNGKNVGVRVNGKDESTAVQINAKYEDAPRIPFPDSDLQNPAPQVYEESLSLDRLVVPHGGEYFFTPSMSALKEYLPKV
ncbi:hypothetical protein N7516_011102 [Penicillium verrucosum]|uniref:uncharacterized protein n=1 Tax=Penicillium verrucosum TaxID=60171 RepID=UPI002544E960|nr:uncharacterized protein N7516_011102 [Penicillium verrucosum]KAJ5920244.1 hypothetical protein N7516_011102 [Penicillium verrucosum]